MKFNLVPIGEQFSFQGVVYTKSGPIAASAELDGKSRMIPRSANVKLSNQIEADENIAIGEKLLPSVEVVAAVNNYHDQCLECLVLLKSDISEQRLDEIKTKLNSVRHDLINSFKTM